MIKPELLQLFNDDKVGLYAKALQHLRIAGDDKTPVELFAQYGFNQKQIDEIIKTVKQEKPSLLGMYKQP